MIYAKDTQVSPEKSMEEIKRLLRRYGAQEFATFESAGKLSIGFKVDGGFSVRLDVTIPPRSDFATVERRGRKVARGADSIDAAHAQAIRQRWRVLVLWVKAKLEAIENEVSTMEQEFMPWIIMPGGQTLGQRIIPQLEASVRTGKMPPLLEASKA